MFSLPNTFLLFSLSHCITLYNSSLNDDTIIHSLQYVTVIHDLGFCFFLYKKMTTNISEHKSIGDGNIRRRKNLDLQSTSYVRVLILFPRAFFFYLSYH